MSIKVIRGFKDGFNFIPMAEGNIYRVERRGHTYDYTKDEVNVLLEETKELHEQLSMMLYL